MKNYRLGFFVAILAVAATLTGCAAPRNLQGEGSYPKEVVANEHTYFRQVWAVTDDDELKVFGRLRLKNRVGINVPDYVEVALLDADDKVIDRQKVAYYPKLLTGSPGHREARFTARFPETPPRGTVVRLRNVN